MRRHQFLLKLSALSAAVAGALTLNIGRGRRPARETVDLDQLAERFQRDPRSVESKARS